MDPRDRQSWYAEVVEAMSCDERGDKVASTRSPSTRRQNCRDVPSLEVLIEARSKEVGKAE